MKGYGALPVKKIIYGRAEGHLQFLFGLPFIAHQWADT